MDYTILVVDDHQLTVDLIKTYLERERYAVITTDNGRDALELARQTQPDLIVLDLMLPRVDGLDVCRILRSSSDIPIIMLTAKSTEDDMLLGLDLGADDYITKPFSPRELVARVRTVLRRTRQQSTTPQTKYQELHFGDLTINVAQHKVYHKSKPISLTPREFKLLIVITKEPGRVFSRGELLERSFGQNTESLERAVDYHIMNLRRKIQTETQNYIQTVYGVGYTFNHNSSASQSANALADNVATGAGGYRDHFRGVRGSGDY
jgi:DNA-binding response OmpR family regulator